MKFKQLILATCAAVTMYAVPASAIEIKVGAANSDITSPLVVTNADLYNAASGYKHPMTLQTTGVFAGLYQAAELVFTSLAFGEGGATMTSFLGIAPDPAGNGQYSIVVEGPAGATFSFYEPGSTVADYSITTGNSGQWEIFLTEGAEPGDQDINPYGSIKGRNFTVDKEGEYTVTFRFSELSNWGPGAGPRHPTTTFTMVFDATAIPEPSTFALLGLAGIAGGAAVVRSRRKKA
jgi:hypothetical protein